MNGYKSNDTAKPQGDDCKLSEAIAWAVDHLENTGHDDDERLKYLKSLHVPDVTPRKPDEPLFDDRRTPKGFKLIEAYTDYKTVVIMGDPYLLDGDNHNCDAMGCGSMDHVIARMPILPEDTPQPTTRLLEAAKAVVLFWGQPIKRDGEYMLKGSIEKLQKTIEAIEKGTQGGNEK